MRQREKERIKGAVAYLMMLVPRDADSAKMRRKTEADDIDNIKDIEDIEDIVSGGDR